MSILEWIAEQRIAEAQSGGAFDDLAGRGRRLALDDDAAVPCEWRAAFRLLKSAGFAPEWVTLGRMIDDRRRGLQAALSKGGGLGADRRAEIAALNRAIDDFNLRVPHACFQKLRFRI
jgi:DnaJ homologue, subfamily C, member 28, conserved domain